MEALQAAYGRQAGLGVVKGEKFPVHVAQSFAVDLSDVGSRYVSDVLQNAPVWTRGPSGPRCRGRDIHPAQIRSIENDIFRQYAN